MSCKNLSIGFVSTAVIIGLVTGGFKLG
jgi:hypothetical protein